MNISSDVAWQLLRGYFEDSAVVFAAVVIERTVTAAMIGRITGCDETCDVSGDGFARLSFARHALHGAEYAAPREALPMIGDRLREEGMESGLRLDFGPERWGFMLHLKQKEA
jgi:hypothetical protein